LYDTVKSGNSVHVSIENSFFHKIENDDPPPKKMT